MKTNIILRTKKHLIQIQPCINGIDGSDLCDDIARTIAKYELGFIVIKHSTADFDTNKDNFRESLYLEKKKRCFVGEDTTSAEVSAIVAKHLDIFRCDAANDYSELTVFFDLSKKEDRVFNKIQRDDGIYRQDIAVTVFDRLQVTTDNIFNIICYDSKGIITVLITKDDFYVKDYQSARYFTDYTTRMYIGDEFGELEFDHRFKEAFKKFVDDDSSHFGKIEISYDIEISQEEVIKTLSFPELNAYREEDR